MRFQLKSNLTPKGDQPKVIRELSEWSLAGKKFQTLMGVTGSGKSVTANTLILTKHNGNIKIDSIGKLIDELFNTFRNNIQVIGETELLNTADLDENFCYETYSIDPVTKKTSWKPLAQFSRHRSPQHLYRITTTCGREVTVTGDHNLFILRDGSLKLIKTQGLQKRDYLPLPLSLEEPKKSLRFFYLPEYIHNKSRLYVSIATLASQYIQDKKIESILPWDKRYRIVHRAERVQFHVYQKLLAINPRIHKDAKIGNRAKRYQMPLRAPITNKFLRFLGYYIAEGHAEKGYFLLSSANKEIISDFNSTLSSLPLKATHRPHTYDYQISSDLWSNLLIGLCGRDSKTKHLPNFFLQLSQTQLANLLNAYFSGDGGINGKAITSTTASEQLSSELLYALLRFGIIARVRKKFITIPGKSKPNSYWVVSISGQKFLTIFQQKIGFSVKEKNRSLKEILTGQYNTNVDVIPAGAWIGKIRKDLSLSQRDIAQVSCIERSFISMIENGKRMPSREVFRNIISALEKHAVGEKYRKSSDVIKEKTTLLNAYWTVIKTIEKVQGETYVYDLSVKDNETFLAGRGGIFVHNTYMLANVIERLQKPTLVVSHNKTLASQLYQEFKDFFPNNAVHYFVSYYDYYQPEAYLPPSDTYIEKDAKINDEIDRLRHAATQSLLTRDDVIVVASVSCIYNIGSPEEYQKAAISVSQGQIIKSKTFIKTLVTLQYERSDVAFLPGTFRVRGDTIDIFLPAGGEIVTLEFFGDEIERISLQKFKNISELFNNSANASRFTLHDTRIFPAKHFVTPMEKLDLALENIKLEMEEQVALFKKQEKYVEAQRLRERTNFDLEMIKETGFCNGIENYSRQLDFRAPGEPAYTLLDFFPRDFLLVVDESHITIPQFRGMYEGDRSRKSTLVQYGFRLPSALDNRPLKFPEFEGKYNQVIFSSATPGAYELTHSKDHISEAVVRPTGLLDPLVEARPTKGQLDDILKEIKARAQKNERSLVLTLTKRHAEDLAEYLEEKGVNVLYLHSEIKTLERPEILYKLRKGDIDAIVGINLLREGLDLPEVSFIAILDADKEGFLRNLTSFIQMFGRAARHINGFVALYTDTMTGSIQRALFETQRRRRIQEAYNKTHGITPEGIVKEIKAIEIVGRKPDRTVVTKGASLQELEKEMWEASKNLQFEKAALLRDKIREVSKKQK